MTSKVSSPVVWKTALLTAVFLRLLGDVPADAAENGAGVSTRLRAGRAALADGMAELAGKQIEKVLSESDGLSPEQAREASLLLARALHEQGLYAEMLEKLKPGRGALKQVRDDADFSFWRALALHRLGRHQQALAELAGSAGEIDADADVAGRSLRLKAWCYRALDRQDEAVHWFAAFDKAYPMAKEAPTNLLEWGKTLYEGGRPGEARAVLTRLTRMPMELAAVQEGHYWLARMAMDEARPAEARKALKAVIGCEEALPDLRAESWFTLGVLHEMQTNVTAAVAALSNGMASARSPEVRQRCGFMLGRLMVAGKNPDRGRELLRSLVAAVPEHELASDAQLLVAHSLLEQDAYEQATDEFQRYVETFTNVTGRALGLRGKGWALLKSGHFAEAASAFEKAVDLFSDPADKAHCLFKAADALFRNEQYKRASSAYERVLAEFPGSTLAAQALFQSAECAAHAGQLEEAEQRFLEVAGSYPRSEFAEEALLRIAELKQQEDRWRDAVDAFSHMIKVYTNSALVPDALYGRGSAYFQLFRIREALEDFERVVRDFPSSAVAPLAMFKKGLCYYWLGRDEEAMAVCRGFLESHAESQAAPDALFWLAKYQYNQGDYENAEKNLLAFVEKFPSHELADDCLLRAGLAASRRKEYLHAIETFTRFVKEYPDSKKMDEVRYAQGDALTQLAKFSAAILIFEEMIHKYPESSLIPAAWSRKGDCQFMLGAEDPKRYEESIESYRVVVSTTGVGLGLLLKAHCMIGRALEKTGRPMQAFEHYYSNVIVRYFDERDQGVWADEHARVWFLKAAWNAVNIMEARKDWRKVTSLLKRIVAAGGAAAEEAAERLAEVRAERWWLH